MPLKSEDPRPRVTARVDADLKERYEAVLDDRGRSISDDLREHIERVVHSHNGGDQGGRVPPAEDDLAEAYAVVLELAPPGGGWVPQDVVLSELAQRLPGSKKTVGRRYLGPLAKRGYLTRQSDTTGYAAVKPFR